MLLHLEHGVVCLDSSATVYWRIQICGCGHLPGERHSALTVTHLNPAGLGVLAAGAGPTMVGYFLQGGLKFGGYELWKDVIASMAGAAFVERFAALVHMVRCPFKLQDRSRPAVQQPTAR